MSDLLPQLLSRQQARQGATRLALVRGAVGLAAYLLPKPTLSVWIGNDQAGTPAARLLGRTLGGRDLALAAGAILSIQHDAPVRGWVEGGFLSDCGDAVATLVAWRYLPRTRWLVLASTLGAIAAGAVLAPSVDAALDDIDEETEGGDAHEDADWDSSARFAPGAASDES